MLLCFSYIVAIFWWPSQLWLTSYGIRKSFQHDNCFRHVRASGHPWLILYSTPTFSSETLASVIEAYFTFNLFQVAIHAIGDKANDLILDMYESIALKNGKRDRRFRVMVKILRIVLPTCAFISSAWMGFLVSNYDFRLSTLSIWPLAQRIDLANKGLLLQYRFQYFFQCFI